MADLILMALLALALATLITLVRHLWRIYAGHDTLDDR